MTVTIYSCSCETIVLNKTSYLTSLASFSGTVRDQVDIVEPRILVAGNVIAGNVIEVVGATMDEKRWTRIKNEIAKI